MIDLEWLTNDVVAQQVLNFINPAMLVLIVILIGIGAWLKSVPFIKDWTIPFILGLFSIVVGIFLLQDVLEGIIQGLLVVMAANYIVNLYKQYKKRKEDDKQ